jgi:signal transduction histidine kinase
VQHGTRILLIDDEEIVLDSCTEILRGEPYDLATATDGARGLAMLRDFRPDLVVVDLKMPGLSGFDVLDRIRGADATIVPIVITGYATVSSAVEAMKRGAYDFLPKPFTPDEFRLIVRRAAEKRALVLETLALRRERELLREHFAAIVSHEVKAPLAAVQQNLWVLERELATVATPDQRQRLERIRTRVGDMLKLVDTWRRGVAVDLASIAAQCAALAVSGPIQKAVESVAGYAVRKAIDIVTSVPDPAPQVWGHDVTLTEALVNIIGNAVKYTPDGGRITVAAQAAEGAVTITVTDTGPGIGAEDLPHVFDAFYSSGQTSTGERGSGLGLAVSRRIVEAHGGSLAVESTPGQGSTFVITLPGLAEHGPTGPGRDAGPPAA